jgi:small subunit ribosomal protein S7
MRRKQAEQHQQVSADPVHDSEMVAQFVNHVMQDGKRSLAQRIVYGALELVEERTGEEGIDQFEEAVNNVAPLVEVRGRRVGGATYQVPMEVRPERRTTLAFRWIIDAANNGRERTMVERLATEIANAANDEGGAVRKKDDMHRMAEANKAFAHFRF